MMRLDRFGRSVVAGRVDFSILNNALLLRGEEFTQSPRYRPHDYTSQQTDRKTYQDCYFDLFEIETMGVEFLQFATTYLHLHLHGSAPFKSLTTPDNQSKVMSAEPGVRVRSVFVCKAS